MKITVENDKKNAILKKIFNKHKKYMLFAGIRKCIEKRDQNYKRDTPGILTL